MPVFFKNQKGVFPLFLLIAIGVAVLVGGSYIVREQFLKTGKSGKTAFDNKKTQEQINNPKTLPSLSPEPSGEKTYGQSVTYRPSSKPKSNQSGEVIKEPSFSINPPSGWEKVNPSLEGMKIQFRHPEEDKEKMEDGLFVKSHAQVSVYMEKATYTLNQLTSSLKAETQKNYDTVNIISQQKTTFAGQEAYIAETELTKKGATLHTLDYYFIKDGFTIHIAGTTLGSVWGKRSLEIKSAINSFKLLD